MKSLSVLFTLLACFSFLSSGLRGAQNSDLVGRWVVPDQKESYLEFQADGTCIMSLLGDKHTINYTVKDSEVSLLAPGRPPLKLQFADNTLTFPDGTKWNRGGGTTSAAPAAQNNAAEIAGHYIRSRQDTTYYDLHPDGTYTFGWQGHTSSGTYRTTASEVTLKNSGGLLRHLRFDHGSLTDIDGIKLTKANPADGAVKPAPTPAASTGSPAAPVEGAAITLTPKKTLKRYGAEFPTAQMPANLQGYFWVVDRPDGQTKVSEMHHNEWHLSGLAGVYKIRVEYRSGETAKTVSNVLEVTVPAK